MGHRVHHLHLLTGVSSNISHNTILSFRNKSNLPTWMRNANIFMDFLSRLQLQIYHRHILRSLNISKIQISPDWQLHIAEFQYLLQLSYKYYIQVTYSHKFYNLCWSCSILPRICMILLTHRYINCCLLLYTCIYLHL